MKTVQENKRPRSLIAPMADRADWKRRLVVSIPLAILLLGPTPGAVGSCSQDAEDNRVLNAGEDLIKYCQTKEQYICYRRHLREEIDADEYNICANKAELDCETKYWAPRCRPTQRRAEACLRALSSMDTLDTDESELKECLPSEVCKDVKVEESEPSDRDAGSERSNLDAGSEPSILDAGDEPSDLDAGDEPLDLDAGDES